MKPKISLITLGVQSIAASTCFYRDVFGFPVYPGSTEQCVFFHLDGTWLAVYPKDALARDACMQPQIGTNASITLAHNVSSPGEVDDVITHLVAGGATLIKASGKTDWGGYSGYVADPDGYRWEVAYNPFTDLT